MATNNSWNVATGTVGSLCVGQGVGTAPLMTNTAEADFTFTTAVAAGTRTLTVSNTDNTNAASSANFIASVGGTNAGDPFGRYAIGTARSYAVGIDNSDSDILKINTAADATASPSSGTNLFSMTTLGARTLPEQPSFQARRATTDVTNATGGGTTYTIIFNQVNTIAPSGSTDFDTTTGTYTIPVTGFYHFTASVNLQGITASMTTILLLFSTSGGTDYGVNINPAAIRNASNNLIYPISTIRRCTAGQTITVVINISGGTDTVTIAQDQTTKFRGILLG